MAEHEHDFSHGRAGAIDLAEACYLLAHEIHHLRDFLKHESSHGALAGLVTLKALQETETRILMKLSEVKAQVAAAASRSKEAFAEVSTRLADIQRQLDDVIAGNSDPEITDEAFATDLATLKTTVDQLADIVPNPAAPPAV